MRLDALSDFDVGWLAGMLDGEGYITIYKGTRGFTSALIGITSTTKAAIDVIVEMSGMGYVYADPKPKSATYNIGYHWRVHKTEDVFTLLLKLLPYLRIKRPQAVLAVNFCIVKIKDPHARNGTLEQKCAPLYEEMKTLNKRGVKR